MKTLADIESKILAGRWGADQRAVLKWMKARGFESAMDLQIFSTDHDTAMELALADFWEFST